MTYEEIVDLVRSVYEYADARNIFEHIAVQVNLEGEVQGAFYIEVAQRKVCVEPYDYHDRDGLITVTAETICAIVRQEITFTKAYETGLLRLEGNMDKLHTLANIKIPKKKKTTKAK